MIFFLFIKLFRIYTMLKEYEVKNLLKSTNDVKKLIQSNEEVKNLLKSIDEIKYLLKSVNIILFFKKKKRVYKCLICNDDKYNELNII